MLVACIQNIFFQFHEIQLNTVVISWYLYWYNEPSITGSSPSSLVCLEATIALKTISLRNENFVDVDHS